MKVRIGLNLGEPHTLFRLHSAPRLTDREGQHLLGLGNAVADKFTLGAVPETWGEEETSALVRPTVLSAPGQDVEGTGIHMGQPPPHLAPSWQT